jgi:hypothetical protein
MTAFPVFDRLVVSGYGMYPGTKAKPGLDIAFGPGLTLILGANGLGKTTLVNMLYRMCSGPTDIPSLAGGGELGGRSLASSRLGRSEQRQFAERVVDRAVDATATLEMELGASRLAVTRSLQTLELLALEVDDHALGTGEGEFQKAIVRAAGLSTFADWILLLRHVAFYFEDRRALVWDPTAQRQIFRMLLLPSETSDKWSKLERDILTLDSRMRNLLALLTREERHYSRAEAALGTEKEVRDELQQLEAQQGADHPRLDRLDQEVVQLDAGRTTARLNALRAALAQESAYRDLERRQLLAIDSVFPTQDATARYLLSKLFANQQCVTCGSPAPDAAAAMRDRLEQDSCVVCGHRFETSQDGPSFSTRSLKNAESRLQKASAQSDAAEEERQEVESAYAATVAQLQTLNATVSARTARIDALVARLPPEEAELHDTRAALAGFRLQVEEMKTELARRRRVFGDFITSATRTVATRSDAIQSVFAEFADGFLLENCRLSWSPHKAQLGQTGQQMTYPAFELDMGGTDYASPVRRRGPLQVSESQREFVDLAFRMTLMTVAGSDGVGSLVIDAPESSLDAVFVTRAATVLTRFSHRTPDNRLIVTSNLIEGDLIPELLSQSGIESPRDPRVVDLLQVAAPTAATRQLSAEYRQVRVKLFARAASL